MLYNLILIVYLPLLLGTSTLIIMFFGNVVIFKALNARKPGDLRSLEGLVFILYNSILQTIKNRTQKCIKFLAVFFY